VPRGEISALVVVAFGGHADFEEVRVGQQSTRGGVAATRDAIDAHAAEIHEGVALCELANTGDVV
jgi:hypothetical protein